MRLPWINMNERDDLFNDNLNWHVTSHFEIDHQSNAAQSRAEQSRAEQNKLVVHYQRATLTSDGRKFAKEKKLRAIRARLPKPCQIRAMKCFLKQAK